ncbi:hypothetical protein AD952_00165 [Acetobacter cerevisiae]|uniref:Uncharacterized protein n=1 Tax=Acetobacter cerevisiae TaxID=178900 RepID=A0A149UYL9_9PROT|nr:hypothetical protein AD952_00165 [Acetobacter cerevisiae]
MLRDVSIWWRGALRLWLLVLSGKMRVGSRLSLSACISLRHGYGAAMLFIWGGAKSEKPLARSALGLVLGTLKAFCA